VAPEPVRTQPTIRFGDDFEFDPRAYQLRRSGRTLKLERTPMEVLLFLIEQKDQLVTREQIAERIWGKNTFLDTDNSINGAIRKIRQVLNDDPDHPRFVQTVTGRGYRFIAPVEEISGYRRSVAKIPSIGAGPAIEVQGLRGPRWLVLVGICAALTIAAFAAYFGGSRSRVRPQPSGERLMLAILPFQNLTGDTSQDYFSDGMTEEMISQLGNLDPQHLGVIARTSVMHYKGGQAPLDQIGRELGVQYVIEGSVRRDAGRVRISAQLIQVKDQTHVWARQYDREVKDLLALQAEIAREITDEISLTLGDPHRFDSARDPASSSAAATSYETYDLYLKGRYCWNKRTMAGFQEAARYFQQAIAKDPGYAQAYAGLADTYGLMSTWGWVSQNEFMPRARDAALKALELDDALAEAHASLALIAENYDYDWQTAEEEFRRAIQLDPNYATAHQWYAEYLSWQGRFDEALVESEQARRLDPMSLIIATDHGAILYYARQYDRAIAQFRAVLDMEPHFNRATMIVSAYVEEGRFQEAMDEVERSLPPDDSPWTCSVKAYVYGRWGRTAQAQQAMAKLEQTIQRVPGQQTSVLLTAYLGTNQKDQGIALLQKAYAEHSHTVVDLKVGPAYDPWRSDPRFQDLLRRMNFRQ